MKKLPLLLTLAASLSAPIVFAAGPAYTVLVIPPPSGLGGVVMQGINSSGQVAGYGLTGGNTFTERGFIGSPSGSTLIPLTRGSTYSECIAINDSGQVAGTMASAAAEFAFIGTSSTSALIPTPNISSANGINNSGQVAGGFPAGAVDQAFIGTPSGITPIPFLPGWTNMEGTAVNSAGQVVGTVNNATASNSGNPSYQAFLWTTGGSALVPLPSGFANSKGLAINDSGQMVGEGWNNGSNYFAFIGTSSGSTAIPLPLGAAFFSQVGPQSISNSGVVAGDSDAGPWIWDATNGTRLLQNYVPAGWNIFSAISISNNGLILAQGSLNGGAAQYVELVPATPTTPAPPTWPLAIFGLTLLALFRKLASNASGV